MMMIAIRWPVDTRRYLSNQKLFQHLNQNRTNIWSKHTQTFESEDRRYNSINWPNPALNTNSNFHVADYQKITYDLKQANNYD